MCSNITDWNKKNGTQRFSKFWFWASLLGWGREGQQYMCGDSNKGANFDQLKIQISFPSEIEIEVQKFQFQA